MGNFKDLIPFQVIVYCLFSIFDLVWLLVISCMVSLKYFCDLIEGCQLA
jgi:hypothetical protein